MSQSIQTLSKEINKKFSDAAIARHVTTPNKLSRSLRSFLKGIRYYSHLEKGYCHMAIKKIGAELSHWGASKCIGPAQSYKLYRQLINLGLIVNARPNPYGTFETVLTELGNKIYESITFESYAHPIRSTSGNSVPVISCETKVSLSENHDCFIDLKTKDRVGSVDNFSYYRCEKTSFIRFYDDTIQNLADNYGFEEVRESLRTVKSRKIPAFNPVGLLIHILGKRHPEEIVMKTETTSIYQNALSAQQCKESALIEARKRLEAQGIHYPSPSLNSSPLELYDAMREYSIREATLVRQILNPVAQPRPLAFNNTKKVQEWGKPYYD